MRGHSPWVWSGQLQCLKNAAKSFTCSAVVVKLQSIVTRCNFTTQWHMYVVYNIHSSYRNIAERWFPKSSVLMARVQTVVRYTPATCQSRWALVQLYKRTHICHGTIWVSALFAKAFLTTPAMHRQACNICWIQYYTLTLGHGPMSQFDFFCHLARCNLLCL